MAAKEGTKRKAGGKDFKGSKFTKKPKAAAVDPSKSSSAQKREVRKDRQSHRRHADVVADAKVLWNKLRLKTNTSVEKEALMDQVMELIRGKVNEIALQHDASRVVQAAIQFGNEEQRKEIMTELCASSLPELAKIQYAHFCCLKLIKYCARDEASVKLIVKNFKGTLPKLSTHAVAARVVESLFREFPHKATASLKQELYGPHFSLFSADKILGGLAVPTLKSNLESASTTDTQKQAATTFVKDILSKGMTKSFFGYTYFQELFAEYMEVADAGDIRTMAPSVVDHSIHLLSTRAGTKVVAACASYGTPKDRKRICKSLKGYMKSSLLHKDAYMAVLRLCQVTDDTVSIHKSLLNEILTVPTPKSTSIDDEEGESESPLLELALDENASKLFLMLLLEDDEARNKYFDPSYEQAILEEQPMVKENGELVPTSKKDPNARRLELLQYLNQGLIELCTNHAEELLESLPGSRVLKEVYSTIAPQEVVDATIQVCVASFDEKTDEEDASLSLFEDPVSHRSIKNLILSDEKNEKPLFAQAFVEQLGDRLMDISASNRGAFVVAALFKIPSVKPKALAKLKSGVKKLKELSKQKGATAGYDALLKEIS